MSKKTIGIDARMYGLRHAGIGRYTQNLIDNLSDQKDFTNFNWVLFVRRQDKETLQKKLGQKFNLIEADFDHYSIAEQIHFPAVLKRAGCDLVHFPHFNVPLLYRGDFVVTIHDLIKHHWQGRATTTRSPLTYQIKLWAYQIVIKRSIKDARQIFTPSQFARQQIQTQYPDINFEKILVTYEGVDSHLQTSQLTNKDKIFPKYQIKSPYLLYVGSLYPHKNVTSLLKAVKILNQSEEKINLVIVSARNAFWQKIKEQIDQEQIASLVNLAGFVPDQDLALLYQEAEAFVFPSLMEGFGLPGLEAMSLGCPLIAAKSSCLPEVYGSAALFFDPHQPQSMVQQIKKLIHNKTLRGELIKKGYQQVGHYSWSKCAQETMRGYQKALPSQVL